MKRHYRLCARRPSQEWEKHVYYFFRQWEIKRRHLFFTDFFRFARLQNLVR